MRCVICGDGAAKKIERKNYRARYGGEPVEVPKVEMFHCVHCGEDFFVPGQAKAFSAAVKNQLRRKLGLLPPERIAAIRKKVGLSQAELERLLGQGEKVVTRWETGKVIQGKSADTTIRLLERDPRIVSTLREIERNRRRQQHRYTPSSSKQAASARV
jgi:putative zinc finger/helix-turn-helix YgiT family protein